MTRKRVKISCLVCLSLTLGLWAMSYLNFIYVGPSGSYILSKGGIGSWTGFTMIPGMLQFGGYNGLDTIWWPEFYSGFCIPLWMPAAVFLVLFLVLWMPSHCWDYAPFYGRYNARKHNRCAQCESDEPETAGPGTDGRPAPHEVPCDPEKEWPFRSRPIT